MVRFRFVVMTLVLVLAAVAPVPAEEPAAGDRALPDGLVEFLDACRLESAGDYRAAVERFASAHELNPDVLEVRVRYAAILFHVGMYEKTSELLAGMQDRLDYFGLRVYALATATLALHDKADMELARDLLASAVDQRADDGNLMMSLVQVEHRLGNLEAAEKAMQELRSARSASPQLIAYHAGLLVELGRTEEAVELFRLCTGDFAVGDRCLDNLVNLLVDSGKPGEAGEVLAANLGADELDGLIRAAALLSEGGRATEGLRVVRRVLEAQPDSNRARGLEAFLLSRLGRFEESIPIFEYALRADPENTDLLLPLAWAQARSGDVEGARESLQRAWEVVSRNAGSAAATSVCLSAAQVELAIDNPMIARGWLERVSSPDRAGADYVRYYAESYRRSEQWQAGVAAMLRLQPKLPPQLAREARAFEGEFRLRLGDREGLATLRPLLASEYLDGVVIAVQVLQATERWSDVVREADRALERFPDDEFLLFSKAGSMERLGDVDGAAGVFERVLLVNPDNVAAANYLGYMWADRGSNLDRALELIITAVEAEPENSAYLDSLGWVYFRLGELVKARHWLERAVELGATDGTVLGHLGEVHLAAGDTAEALRWLRQALSKAPEDSERIRRLIDENSKH